MRLSNNGATGVTWWHFRWLALSRWAEKLRTNTIYVDVDPFEIAINAHSYREYFRATTYNVKEPGTLQWLRESLSEGDVFFDIGANIGLYSLYAAKFLNGKGKVYAFEPHAVNYCSLISNIRTNGLVDTIIPSSTALNENSAALPFNYHEWESGSTASQVDGCNYDDYEFKPVLTELKSCLSVDDLVESGAAEAPDVIKMDVDGIELGILKGMRRLLRGSHRPRTMQVELNRSLRDETLAFIAECGYEVTGRNFTQAGQEARDNGVPVEQIPHNIVCQPISQ